ncbi:MAG: V-type ATP synthase subunit E [Clostridia bacterium]|nr:V-type ATP synthase subunit E [Clostridia bacterium]
MEVQLGEIIEQIKKDGVEAAETEAAAILEKANAEAASIVAQAKAEAEKLLANAKAENERTVSASEEALRQAGRNLLLSFRESVSRELAAVVEEEVAAVYSSEKLAGLIVKTVEAFAANSDAEGLTVLLNEEDLSALEASLLAKLRERMLTGVTLKASDRFDGGFRISVEGGHAYYDYSASAVVEMLSGYLSPKVTALLREAE